MGRRPCCSKEGLNRGAWTALEDKILADYIKAHGEGKWRDIPRSAGLKRCGKSCRLRWLNYLRPDIKRGNITKDEEDLIIRMHKLLGNRWSLIAGRLPGRTDNEIKNYWNTNLSKKIESKQPKKQQQQLDLGSAPGPAAVRVKPSRCTAALVVVPNQKDQFAANSASTVPAECALSDDKSTTSSAGFVCSEFDVGEISLAEILDSDHMARSFGDLDEYDRLDQPFLGLKEMMESGMDSDLRSLSFLLDSEAEDWLTEDLSIVDPS